jgi:hypothetical protein
MLAAWLTEDEEELLSTLSQSDNVTWKRYYEYQMRHQRGGKTETDNDMDADSDDDDNTTS